MAQQMDRNSRSTSSQQVMVSTTKDITGYEIVEYLGVVFGITVRTRGIAGQCVGGCETCFGGEVTAYTQSAIEARNDAIQRLCRDVFELGGNGVIGVKFDSSRSGSMTDIVAYGTAVRVRPKERI